MTSLLQQMESYQLTHAPLSFDLAQQVIEEAFIRRVAKLNLPLMLKGSFVTRQYLPENLKNYRLTADLDWFGLGELNQEKLNNWMIAATNHHIDDGITFRDFRENAFWRCIDYAMADDFPTVSTDIAARFNEAPITDYTHELYAMDISFNIKLFTDPIAITYQPLFGEPFIVPYSCPLDTQLAWKLHQCIVAPRFKDLIDLIWLLLANPNINWDIVFKSIQEECKQDNPERSNIQYLHYLLNNRLAEHPFYWGDKKILERLWESWYTGDTSALYNYFKGTNINIYSQGTLEQSFLKNGPIPSELTLLLEQIHNALNIPEFIINIDKYA